MLDMTYAVRDLGHAPFRLSQERYPFGANFAVRAAEQARCRYDANLGMAPGRGRLGEETSVIRRILATGAIGYWVPDARLEHCIGRSDRPPPTSRVILPRMRRATRSSADRLGQDRSISAFRVGCGGIFRKPGFATASTV